jgi:Patatin-like phospholipase
MNQPRSASSSAPRKVALALQGGGSHGAFTWGVLDRMLEDEKIEIVGVTGTSAGAMNAIVLADGMVRGGRKQARMELRQFWEAIGKMVGFNSFLIWPMSGETAASTPLEHNPFYMAIAMLSRSLSPYDLNPLNYLSTMSSGVSFTRSTSWSSTSNVVASTQCRSSNSTTLGRLRAAAPTTSTKARTVSSFAWTEQSHLRTSLRSSRSPFPGKSDFRVQRQNGHNVRRDRVRESRDQVDRAGRRQYVGIWGRPREISAVRRLIGGAMRTRTKDPDGFIDGAR